MASATSAGSCGSPSAATQLSCTASAGAASTQCAGSFMFGRFSWASASRSGAVFSEQAETSSANASAAHSGRSVARKEEEPFTRMSVQLQDQVIELRADAQNHLAQDMDRLEVLGVHRAVARGARREERRGLLRI